MCDILISLPDASAENRVVFGKNSDRPAGETQVLYDSGTDRPAGSIQCAFVEVPNVEAPLRTIGTRPYWCWGYETGMNDAGVVAGNTAVYTRSFHQPENREAFGLTGMELLRLGLERGHTAAAVLENIVELLAQYGQWAPAVIGQPPPGGCYENAFLIADASEAWFLETSGRRWAARRLDSGVDSLSNELTIRNLWTNGSDDLEQYAIDNGWWKPQDGPFDFALAYSDHENYARQVSHIRRQRSRDLLGRAAGNIGPGLMMTLLRDHYEGTFLQGPQFNQFMPDFLTLCMHDSPAGFTWGNTASSVVVEIDPVDPGASTFWCCYQPPCASTYIAFNIGAGIPATVSAPGSAGLRSESPVEAPADDFRAASLWWRMYRIHNAVSRRPVDRWEEVRSYFDPIERKYLAYVRELEEDSSNRSARMRACLDEQLAETEDVIDRLEREWKLDAA